MRREKGSKRYRRGERQERRDTGDKRYRRGEIQVESDSDLSAGCVTTGEHNVV